MGATSPTFGSLISKFRFNDFCHYMTAWPGWNRRGVESAQSSMNALHRNKELLLRNTCIDGRVLWMDMILAVV